MKGRPCIIRILFRCFRVAGCVAVVAVVFLPPFVLFILVFVGIVSSGLVVRIRIRVGTRLSLALRRVACRIFILFVFLLVLVGIVVCFWRLFSRGCGRRKLR